MLGGSFFFLAYIVFILFNNFLLAKQWNVFNSFLTDVDLHLAVRLAIAFFTGFLFAVTYRYIIRTDENSHLKDGAVLAFGLVKGLVYVEIADNFIEDIYPVLILTIETIISFLITRLTLDFALTKKYIKPFF